jgi:hypothetical protein
MRGSPAKKVPAMLALSVSLLGFHFDEIGELGRLRKAAFGEADAEVFSDAIGVDVVHLLLADVARSRKPFNTAREMSVVSPLPTLPL